MVFCIKIFSDALAILVITILSTDVLLASSAAQWLVDCLGHWAAEDSSNVYTKDGYYSNDY